LDSEEQFNGNMGDILVLGRVLSLTQARQLTRQGAEALLAPKNKVRKQAAGRSVFTRSFA